MALTQLTKVDGGGISTTSDYRVGIITASKFVGPFDGTGGNFSGVVTATNGVFSGNISAVDGNFSGNVTIGGTLTYEDVSNIDSVGIITARDGIDCNGDLDVDGHTNLDNVSVAGVTTFSDTVKVGTGITFDTIGDAEFCGVVTFNNRRGGMAAHFPNNEMLVFGNSYLYGNIRNTGSVLTFDALNQYRFNCWDGNSMEQWMGVNGVGGVITLGGYSMGTGSGKAPRFQIQGSNHLIKMFSSEPNSTTLTERFSLSQSGINFTGLSTHTGNFDLDGDLDVDGHTNLDNVNVVGILTVTRSGSNTAAVFSGGGGAGTINIQDGDDGTLAMISVDGGNLKLKTSGGSYSDKLVINPAGNVSIAKDLDVDGHTNLDNVSVAGVSTFTGNADFSAGVDVTGTITATGEIRSQDDIRIQSVYPRLYLTDTDSNDDFSLINNNGSFLIYNDTQNDFRLKIDGTTGMCAMTLRPTVDSTYNLGTNTLRWANVYADTYYGDGDFVELDVDGHTELDNVNIAGIATFNHGGSEVVRINSGGLLLYNDLSFFGASTHAYWDHSSNQFILNDNTKLSAGNGSDLQIYHLQSDNNSYIVESGSGSLMIQGDIINIGNVGSSKYYIRCFEDGAVQLRYGNNLTKLATTATGIEVTGEVAASQDYPDIRPTLDFNFAATKKLDSRISYHRSGPASYHDEFGKVVLVGADAPRFDHTFPEYWDEGNLGESNSRGISKGLLIERSRTNIYKNNHNLTTANDHGSITQTVNTTETTAPDGTFTATKFNVTGSDQWSRWDSNNGLDISQVNFTDIFTTSIYMKTVGTSNVNVSMDFGDNGQKTFSVGQEWKRYAISNVHHNYGGSTKFIDIVFNGSVYIWGLQCENGENPSSYIPTRGSSETRGDEYVVIDGQDFTDFYNPVESSLLMVGTMHQTLNAQGQLNIAHIGNNNLDGHGIFREHGTRDVWYHIRNNNTTPSGGNINPNGFGDWDENEEARIAIAFKNGDQAISVNGGNQVTATVTSNYPTANITKMWIGSAGNGSFFNGIISRIAYYPKQLTDSQLNTLTA